MFSGKLKAGTKQSWIKFELKPEFRRNYKVETTIFSPTKLRLVEKQAELDNLPKIMLIGDSFSNGLADVFLPSYPGYVLHIWYGKLAFAQWIYVQIPDIVIDVRVERILPRLKFDNRVVDFYYRADFVKGENETLEFPVNSSCEEIRFRAVYDSMAEEKVLLTLLVNEREAGQWEVGKDNFKLRSCQIAEFVKPSVQNKISFRCKWPVQSGNKMRIDRVFTIPAEQELVKQTVKPD